MIQVYVSYVSIDCQTPPESPAFFVCLLGPPISALIFFFYSDIYKIIDFKNI